MATLTPVTPKTIAAIWAAYEAARSAYEPVGINVGDLGAECDRALWYTFRRVSPPEAHAGRTLRIFETGNIEETRILADLRAIGCEVGDEQARVFFVGGHVRGKIDATATGIPEAPKRVHLVECKSSNDDGFKKLRKDGSAKAKPLHYGQVQMYMHGRSLERALYIVVNKNDDDIYVERIAYDVAYCLRMVARAERIITTDDPPSRLHEDPNSKAAFACKWCKHLDVCHNGAWSRRHCRTCLHSTPITTSENACWDCSRFTKPLTLAEQATGCDWHLFLPGVVPGEQIDADAAAETVTYKLRDGTTWVNGRE